ncbi:MAG: hypothetical protein GY796_25680 [Chloroflexi bacterium]|nr:hypothetical protein [Chloroflexota bacterium]
MSLDYTPTCPNCGTPASEGTRAGTVAACPLCNEAYRVADSLTPQPALGPLILRPNLHSANLPGWKVLNRDKLSFEVNMVPEMVATFSAENLYYPTIRTFGKFDDFDIAATIRFLKGDYMHAHAGIEFRNCDEGDYVVSLSPQGTYRVGWHDKDAWGGTLSPWRGHTALHEGWEAPNRLRVIARGDALRVYINGVFATALHDDHFHSGYVRLVLAPKKKKTVVGFSEVELREVR